MEIVAAYLIIIAAIVVMVCAVLMYRTWRNFCETRHAHRNPKRHKKGQTS